MSGEPAPIHESVGRARSLGSSDDAIALYRDWAATYDRDVFDTGGFTGSARIADLVASVVPDLRTPVLDLGCGTGAVGKRLAELGATVIDGVDISAAMLDRAAATGVYRTLREVDLTVRPIEIDERYRALVSAGTFTSGHVGPAVVADVLALLEPGGVIGWVIGIDVWPAFQPVLDALDTDVLHQSLEAIRRDGPPEGVMFVARVN